MTVFFFNSQPIQLKAMTMSFRPFIYPALRTIFNFKITSPGSKSGVDAKRTSKRRILLAEHSLISAVHFESMVERWNFDIDIVQNGDDAIRKVKSTRYDMLFLDIQIPPMGGVSAAAEIRQLGNNPHDLPILVMGRHPVSEETLEFYGVNGMILKPFSREILEDRIGRLLGKIPD